MSRLVFVPLDRAEAVALRSGAGLDARPAYAPTTRLAVDLGSLPDPEEVEFAALSQAGVLALRACADPLRLVVAADVDSDQVKGAEGEPGLVTVTGLRWDQVRSLFADEPGAGPAVARARTDPATVDALLDAYDLLWFSAEELDHL